MEYGISYQAIHEDVLYASVINLRPQATLPHTVLAAKETANSINHFADLTSTSFGLVGSRSTLRNPKRFDNPIVSRIQIERQRDMG